MKMKPYYFLSSLLSGEIRLLLSLPLGCIAIRGLLPDTPDAFYPLLLLVFLPLVHTLIREFTKNIVLFFALHLAAAAAVIVWTLGHPILFTIVCSVYVVLETILSVKERLMPRMPVNTSALVLIPLFAAVVIQIYLGLHDLDRLLPILLGVSILMYLFNIYLLNFIKYSHVDAGRKGIPYKQITGTYHMLLGAFGLLAVGVMILARLIPLGTILSSLGNLLLTVIRFIVGLFPKNGNDIEEIIEETVAETNSGGPMQLPPPKDPFWLWEVLQNITMFIMQVAIIGGIIVGVVVAIYQIYKHFYSRNMDVTDKTESLLFTDRRERVKREKEEAGGRLRRLFPRTHAERIRREFYRLVQKKDQEVDIHRTPRELLEEPAPDHADALSSLYSKARYSDLECSKEDADSFRRLSKGNN